MEVFFAYGAPAYPVALLKYRIVGQPPAPGEYDAPSADARIDSCERLMSPNATAVLFSNALVTVFHAGACLRHQPQPSDAIQRTKSVLPESTCARSGQGCARGRASPRRGMGRSARLLLDEPLEIILSALRHVVKVPLRVDLRAKPLDSCTAELCTRAAGGQGEAG